MPKKQDSYFFCQLCSQFGLPEPEIEHKFHPERRWRADYAWPLIKLAVEIEGGVWVMGRHNRASGYVKDMEKYNAMTELGWFKLSYQPKKIDFEQIKRVYEKLSKA